MIVLVSYTLDIHLEVGSIVRSKYSIVQLLMKELLHMLAMEDNSTPVA